MNKGTEADDLFQIGSIGLIKAIRKDVYKRQMGACPKCAGLGKIQQFDKAYFAGRIGHRTFYDLGMAMLLDYTIAQRLALIEKISKRYGFDMNQEFAEYPDSVKELIISGDGGEYRGLLASLEDRYERKMQGSFETYPLEYYMTECVCPQCGGKRLNDNALSFTVGDLSISDFTQMSVENALAFISGLQLSEEKTAIAESILKELKGRLRCV